MVIYDAVGAEQVEPVKLEENQQDEAMIAFAGVNSDAPDLAARFLKSLAHPGRLRVLCGLMPGEMPVAAIEEKVGASQSAVSQHLARLREEGLVSCRRDGRQMLYSVTDPTALAVLDVLYARFCAPKMGQAEPSKDH